jgi:hypothetical protein
VTYYTAFVLELHSRRVQVIGSTPYPDEAFVILALRHASRETDGLLREGRILICDRDPKWSRRVEHFLGTAGVRVVRTPALCAQLQRLRGAIRPVSERGVPESCRPARGTAFCERFFATSRRTTIASGATKGSGTSCSMVFLRNGRPVPFGAGSESVASSVTTTGQPRGARSLSSMGQNGQAGAAAPQHVAPGRRTHFVDTRVQVGANCPPRNNRYVRSLLSVVCAPN